MKLTLEGLEWPLEDAMTPAVWYRRLRDHRGNADWQAIALLSEIVGRGLRPGPRLFGSGLRIIQIPIDYRLELFGEVTTALGLTRGAARRAAKRLADRGLLALEVIGNAAPPGIRRGRRNGTYIRLNAKQIVELTQQS